MRKLCCNCKHCYVQKPRGYKYIDKMIALYSLFYRNTNDDGRLSATEKAIETMSRFSNPIARCLLSSRRWVHPFDGEITYSDFIYPVEMMNATFDCKRYERVWWKFWAAV